MSNNNPHARSANIAERRESFSATGPVSTLVNVIAGDLIVHAAETDEISVRLTSSGARGAEQVAEMRVEFDVATNALEIRTPRSAERGGRARRFLDFTSEFSDVDVELVVPTHSSLNFHSASGDAALRGSFGSVTATSASGDVIVDHATDATIQSASGDVVINDVTTSVTVKCTSGDVRVGAARGDTRISSVSGDLRVLLDGAGSLDAHSVSGDVIVDVRTGLVVDVDAHSLSGDLHSDIDLSGGETADEQIADERAVIRVHTVSGDIKVRRASGGSTPGIRDIVDRLITKVARFDTSTSGRPID